MSESEPNAPEATNAMAPVVGIGGLLSPKTLWPYYVPLLGARGAQDRFLPIPNRGLSPFDETYGQLEEKLTGLYERLETPVVLFGHSLGALMATELTLRNPDKVAAVEALAGIHDGVDEFTLSAKGLKKILGNPDHAQNLLRGSDFMTDHRRRMASQWPAHVPLHLISPTHDVLIPAPQGLEVELPPGQEPEQFIIAPRLPSLIPALNASSIRQKTAHLPNVNELRPLLPAEHIDLPVSPAVILHTRQLRREVAATAPGAPVFEPAPGLAAMPAAA